MKKNTDTKKIISIVAAILVVILALVIVGKEVIGRQSAQAKNSTSSSSSSTTSTTTTTTTTTTEPAETTTTGSSESESSDGSGKVVYLTFDDGPSQYTQDLLNTLDKYNVKATFFVTHQFSKYEDMIAVEAKKGHTVGIHSYSHDYAKIYSNENAYFEDLDKMNDIIQKQTGQKAYIIRFPGGSSNTVSKKYCNGIMTKLTNSVTQKGYLYTDWNVSSEDASNKTYSADTIANNVINGMKKHKVSVVLQHDTKANSVKAVEKIIQYGQANGYTFKAMSKDSYMVHHKVNN